MANIPELGKIARDFLRANSVGVLATHSLDVEGYPFGSITPYVISHKGLPTILISTLAQHTRNIKANLKVSLTVFDLHAQDVQNSTRLTWIGDATILPKEEGESLRPLYSRYFPNAKTHLDLSDFSFYQITLKRARYIGGFGQIAWVEPSEIILENALQNDEISIIEHMNLDHSSTMLDYCKGLKNIAASKVKMIGVDTEGFDLLVDDNRLRITFDKPVLTAEEVRTALVALARKARANLPTVVFEKIKRID